MNLSNYGINWKPVKAPKFHRDRGWFPVKQSHTAEADSDSKVKQMTTIRQQAHEYTTPKTLNISELDKVSVDLELESNTYGEGDDAFTVNETTIDGVKYRVPNSVLKQLKEHLAEKPEMTEFKVSRSGEGLNTSYTVIPL